MHLGLVVCLCMMMSKSILDGGHGVWSKSASMIFCWIGNQLSGWSLMHVLPPLIAGDWSMVTLPQAWVVTQCWRRHSRGCENEAFGPGAASVATSMRSATR